MHTDFKYNSIDNSNIFIQENALQMLSIKYHPNSSYFIVSNIPYIWLVRNIKWEYQRTLQKWITIWDVKTMQNKIRYCGLLRYL